MILQGISDNYNYIGDNDMTILPEISNHFFHYCGPECSAPNQSPLLDKFLQCRRDLIADPKNGSLHFQYASLFFDRYRFCENDPTSSHFLFRALQEAELGYELDPQNEFGYEFLAFLRMETGNVRGAFAVLDKMIQKTPNNVHPQLIKLDFLLKLKKWRKANRFCRNILRIAPQNAYVMACQAEIIINKRGSFFFNKYRRAEKYILAALRSDPDCAKAIYIRAFLLEHEKYISIEEICECYKHLVKIDPDDQTARARLRLFTPFREGRQKNVSRFWNYKNEKITAPPKKSDNSLGAVIVIIVIILSTLGQIATNCTKKNGDNKNRLPQIHQKNIIESSQINRSKFTTTEKDGKISK